MFNFVCLGNKNAIVLEKNVEDDPRRRRPDITVAMNELNWRPVVHIREGLAETIDYFKKEINRNNLNDVPKSESLYFFTAEELLREQKKKVQPNQPQKEEL